MEMDWEITWSQDCPWSYEGVGEAEWKEVDDGYFFPSYYRYLDGAQDAFFLEGADEQSSSGIYAV